MCGAVIRVQLERSLETGDRLLRTAGLALDKSDPVVGLRVVVPRFERQLQRLLRLFEALPAYGCDGAHHQAI